jgi:hypothetical protein
VAGAEPRPAIYDRAVILGPAPVFVHGRPDVAIEVPELVDAVAAFSPVSTPAGNAAAGWLRERALRVPQESATRLLVSDGTLRGFYALANGHAELAHGHLREHGLHYKTQPATVLTWIARGDAYPGVGGDLLLHALATALRATAFSGSTVLALDPYDEGTARMWIRQGFRESDGSAPGRELTRLWIPLRSDY